MNWLLRIQRSIVIKITLLMGFLIVVIGAMLGINMVNCKRLDNNLNDIKNRYIVFSQLATKANISFLNMDDQSNMWVGLYDKDKNSKLVQDTLAQILSAQDQLNQSLQSAEEMAITPEQKTAVKKAIIDAKAYENYFSQVYQLNYSDHQRAAQIMYADNSDASSQLTSDLEQIENLAYQGLLKNASSASSLSRDNLTTTIAAGTIVILITIFTLFYFRRVIAPIPVISENLKQIAKGDLSKQTIEIKRTDEVGILSQAMNEMSNNMKYLISEMAQKSENVAASAAELSASTENVAAAATETASTIGEIASTVDQVTTNAQRIADASAQAAAYAKEGNEGLKNVVSQMDAIQKTASTSGKVISDLSESAGKITQIVELITRIADQTNLLALNAAIESARAGEHGRGFAVVAEEVRKLAEQSAGAAKEIYTLITSIQQESQMAVESMKQSGTQIETGTQVMGEVRATIEKIINAVQGLAQEIQSVAVATEQMNSGVQNVAAAAEEQTATMEEVASTTQSLTGLAEELDVLSKRFRLT